MTTPLISKYVLASYNGGAHLLVGRGRWLFDFWPSSEKWCQRGGSNNGQGVAGLPDEPGIVGGRVMELVAVLTRSDGRVFHIHLGGEGHREELFASLDRGDPLFDAAPCGCVGPEFADYSRRPSIAAVVKCRVWAR